MSVNFKFLRLILYIYMYNDLRENNQDCCMKNILIKFVFIHKSKSNQSIFM